MSALELTVRTEGFGSYAHAKRLGLVRAVAVTLADGGPVEDEMEAAEQVIATIVEYLARPDDDGSEASR